MLFFIDQRKLQKNSFRFIQIHLMLFFIRMYRNNASKFTIFKYISCYSLSRSASLRSAPLRYSNTSHVILYLVDSSLYPDRECIQIHLMLFFIEKEDCAGAINAALIQIHLMLFFIPMCLLRRRSLPHSNTSHVILYHSANAL